jgi:hypothetical protein
MMIANGCAPASSKTGKLTYRVALAPAGAEADPPVLADHGPRQKSRADPIRHCAGSCVLSD